MKAWEANLQILESVAEGFQSMLDQVFFVGGATTVLYLDVSNRIAVRSTDDVDCVVQIGTNIEYNRLERRLEKLGFTHDVRQGAPICRWLHRGIKVDIMPSHSGVLGFSNRWYEEGIREFQQVTMDSGLKIKIFSLPYFLASKMDAFWNRGDLDYYGSKDLEDIVSVLDGREDAAREILTVDESVLRYLKEQFLRLSNDENFIQSLVGHFGYHAHPEERARRMLDLLRSL